MRWFLIIVLFFSAFSIKAQSPLCASRPTTFCCEYVSSVTINGQTFQGSNGFTAGSGGSPAGYYDYTSGPVVPTITAGQQISISYTGVTNGNYMEYFKLWIDFNGNGVLTDAGELVHSSNYSWLGNKTVTATFTVPTTVYNGPVYMRFIMQYSGAPVICGTYPYGNTFDFKTNIVGAQPNPNIPTPTETISGNLNIPTGLVNRPILKLYEVNGSSLTMVDSVMVDASGNYSLQPTNYNTTYKVIPYFDSSMDNTDFQLVFNESQNENTPDNQPMGLFLNSGHKLKAGDVNQDGKINVGDSFLIIANITGLVNFNNIYWYTENNYNSINSGNFNSINPVNEFVVNFGTSDVILNIRYIVRGDANLSQSG